MFSTFSGKQNGGDILVHGKRSFCRRSTRFSTSNRSCPSAPTRVDEWLKSELLQHLEVLRHQRLLEIWHDREIPPGNDWEERLKLECEHADLFLLLVSEDSMQSEFITKVELPRALERIKTGATRLVPILVREYKWKESPYHNLQALPADAKPATLWPNRREAWADVEHGLQLLPEQRRRSQGVGGRIKTGQ